MEARRPAPASAGLPVLLAASFGAAGFGLCSDAAQSQLGDLATVASAGTNDNAGWGLAAADFDGDGYDDLAVGAPGDATVATNGGFVLWIPGGPCGLESSSNFILQDSFGETTEAGDRFGAALAAGFFDDDPYADLAVGIPGKRIGGEDNAGAVAVLYGSATGLDATTGTLFHQSQLAGVAEAGDQLGFSLTVADFDGDGYDDLAAGAVGEDVGAIQDAGAVNVIYGTAMNGLGTADNLILHRSVVGVDGDPHFEDFFGHALAAGELNGDSWPDLAVGVPGESIDAKADAGMVQVFSGSGDGVQPGSSVSWHQSVPGFQGATDPGDELGFALAVGDLDGDGYDDLAIGAPGDTDQGGGTETGQVHVLVSNDQHGLTATGDRIYWEAMVDPLGVANFDRFGETLTTGDFDGDGVDDLVIGAPLDNPDGSTNAGEVTVLPGTFPNGPTTTGSRVFVLTDVDPADPGAEFGFALASGRFEGDPGDDLAIGAPLYAGGNPARGRVYVAPSLFPFADGFENGDFCGWSQVVP